jgi:hypothetical protein
VLLSSAPVLLSSAPVLLESTAPLLLESTGPLLLESAAPLLLESTAPLLPSSVELSSPTRGGEGVQPTATNAVSAKMLCVQLDMGRLLGRLPTRHTTFRPWRQPSPMGWSVSSPDVTRPDRICAIGT